MFKDFFLSGGEIERLLKIRIKTLHQRVFTGDSAYAFGNTILPFVDQYAPLDAFAILMVSMWSVQIGIRLAATVVREHWELWLELIQRAEADPRFGKVLPATEQLFLFVAPKKKGPPHVEAGLMTEASKFDRKEDVRAISIHMILHRLRTNSRLYGVDLPANLTVQLGDPRHAQWRREIDEYRKFSAARAKAKERKASGRAKETA